MKSFYRHLSTRQLIMAGLVIPLLCTFIIGFLQWQSVRDMYQVRDTVHSNRKVQECIGLFHTSLADSESCHFRYVLSGNKVNLDGYRDHLSDAKAQFLRLRSLLSDNPVQRQNLDQIEPLFNTKMSKMEEGVSLELNGNPAGAAQACATEDGSTMMTIEKLIEKMQTLETNTLEANRKLYQHHFKINSALSILSMLLCVFFIVAILLLLLRLFRLQSAVTANAVSEMIKYEAGGLTIEQYLERRYEALATHGHAQIEAERLIGLIEKKKLRPVKD